SFIYIKSLNFKFQKYIFLIVNLSVFIKFCQQVFKGGGWAWGRWKMKALLALRRIAILFWVKPNVPFFGCVFFVVSLFVNFCNIVCSLGMMSADLYPYQKLGYTSTILRISVDLVSFFRKK
ncbi:MAG TPA: hypothetical protein P5538_10535, partial [Bacteroidales bacterium]|nr:hypothetical protein [Bacteroidales bacterium]